MKRLAIWKPASEYMFFFSNCSYILRPRFLPRPAMLNHHEAANSEQRKRLESVTAEAAQDGMVGPAKGVVQNVFLMKVKTGKGRGTVKSPVFFWRCESGSSSVRHEFISEKKLLMVDKLGGL